ncbi:PREDICTED: uncharacterized protein LOC104825583 [Tarenaya hassleriana]|uniref:uncharacterized protein LOC104825583 n=1 Tax=Tarenaya hassleriana TaxID=28532 RepID=UPI00053C731C|nr:PREDICTED: uncharacterized protein LOC104825583 [Tarenaya hassleriana]
MDPKEKREEKGEDHHLESEEGSSGEGKSSEPRKEESSNSFVSAEEDPEENPSEESRRNPREILRNSKEDKVGEEIQELESPEEKTQEAEIPEEPQQETTKIEDKDLQTPLPPEQADSGKLDDLFVYPTDELDVSSDSEPRLIRKGAKRRVDFDKDVSVQHKESRKDVGDTSKRMDELPSEQLRQEKSEDDAELEVVADSATETEVLKPKEDDGVEVDSRVEQKKSKAKVVEKKGKGPDTRVVAEQRARTRSQVATKSVKTVKSPVKKIPRKMKSQPSLVISEQKTPKKAVKRKGEAAKHMPPAKSSKVSEEYRKEKMKGKKKIQEEKEPPSSPSGSEDEELLASLCMSHHFVDEKSEQRFNDMKNLNTIVERNVNVSNFKEQGIWDFLESLGLEETVTYACPHSKILIKEFYANISKKIVRTGDPMYHRVYIRGKILHFSPAVINKFLGLKNTVVATMDELDREVDQKELEIVLTDSYDEKRKGEIAPVELNFESSVLFKIARSNWLPTQRSSLIHKRLAILIYCVKKGIKVNYGSMIFDHILDRALNFRARFRLPYPCLIQSILTKQCPELIDPKENTEIIQKPLVVESRIKRKKGKEKKDYKKILETLKDAEKALIKMELGLRKQATHCQKIRASVHEYVEATLSNVLIIQSGIPQLDKTCLLIISFMPTGGEIEEAEGDLYSEEEDSEEEEEEESEMPKQTPRKAETSKKPGTIKKAKRVKSSSEDSSIRF